VKSTGRQEDVQEMSPEPVKEEAEEVTQLDTACCEEFTNHLEKQSEERDVTTAFEAPTKLVAKERDVLFKNHVT